jgi:hypothetical protein
MGRVTCSPSPYPWMSFLVFMRVRSPRFQTRDSEAISQFFLSWQAFSFQAE